MTEILHRWTHKILIALLLIISSASLAAPSAAAFNRPEDKNKDRLNDERSTSAAAESAPADAKTPTISYVLYNAATKPQPQMILAADRPQLAGILNRVASVKSNAPAAVTAGAPAVSTAPLTPGEKFKLWAKRFVSPGSYGAAAASGLWNELLDNDEGKKDTVENYFADAATRAARSYAFGTTAGFFEKFAYASLFRQDPRYHRSDKRGAGAKIGYAVSRVFITQGDRCGCDQFNISFLAGGLTAAGISNVWEREERQTVGKTLSRWGTHIAITAMTNIIREFLGGQ